MESWHELPDDQPPEAAECFVRLWRWFATPFLATWNLAGAQWWVPTLNRYLDWNFAPFWRPK
jgi:hypothetical protein